MKKICDNCPGRNGCPRPEAKSGGYCEDYDDWKALINPDTFKARMLFYMKRIANNTAKKTRTVKHVVHEDSESFQEFEAGRKIYPGVKRGGPTEFADFKKKHKDWKDICPCLEDAIEMQIEKRKQLKRKGDFEPPWKHFKTYLYNRCWETEIG